jgi:hypothetical protein
MNQAVQRILASAAALSASAKKVAESRASQGFAQEIAHAVRNKLAPASLPPATIRATVAPKAEQDDFAEAVKTAIEKQQGSGGLLTQKQHKERVERERERYQQRPPLLPPPGQR